MPSPPEALNSSHQAVPSASDSGSHSLAAISEATAWLRPVRAAAPVGAYCCRKSSWALADHGISSQSSHTSPSGVPPTGRPL